MDLTYSYLSNQNLAKARHELLTVWIIIYSYHLNMVILESCKQEAKERREYVRLGQVEIKPRFIVLCWSMRTLWFQKEQKELKDSK